MSKITLNSITTGRASQDLLNSNFSIIQAAFDGCLFLDGTAPNTLAANLDMNGYTIINLPDPVGSTDIATKAYVDAVASGASDYSSRQSKGHTTISSTGGTVTLTTTQFDNLSFDVTGTLTSNLIIEIPDLIPQAFIIENNTTGAFTVIVKHATTAGAIIAQGTNTICFTDGTTVINTAVSPTFVTPALGTPSSGTLDNCTGDLSNCTGGPTLTNATLVTTALGTPSSGTLTNCTGPWVSTYMLHVQDQKANGTEAGASTAATQNVRTLNTVVTNTITGASLATNQITLPAGTYRVWARAPAYITNQHKIRLYNVTDAAVTAVGSSAYTNTANQVSNNSFIQGYRFTISGTKVFRLDHYTQLTSATNGLGVATSSGDIEVYAEVMVIKE